MALTDDDILRFSGPSVWRESDCVEWIYAITDLPRPSTSVWHECDSEARALVRARKVHGGYIEAVMQWLRIHGYSDLQGSEAVPIPGDVIIVDDPYYGCLPCGVASGPQIILRHPQGVALATGRIVRHLRRID